MSDLHDLRAVSATFAYLYLIDLQPWELLLVGDRTADPDFSSTDGINLLKEAKKRAVAQGMNYHEAEELLWGGPDAELLEKQWLGIVEPTIELHKMFLQGVRRGIFPTVVDTGGNDVDRNDRVQRAYASRKMRTGEHAGPALIDIVNNCPAFRSISRVESVRKGPTLDLRVPYIADKSPAILEQYLRDIDEITARGPVPAQVLLFAHLNPDRRLRIERLNEWYWTAYEIVQHNLPETPLVHVFGHCHRLPEPYVLSEPAKFRGVQLVPIGYAEGDNIQRLAIFDYLNPKARKYVDLDFSGARLVRTEKTF